MPSAEIQALAVSAKPFGPGGCHSGWPRVASALLNRWIVDTYGLSVLLILALGVFVVAWIGQFIGHKVEGHRPSFLTDVVFLLIGPLWTLRKLYQRIGIGY